MGGACHEGGETIVTSAGGTQIRTRAAMMRALAGAGAMMRALAGLGAAITAGAAVAAGAGAGTGWAGAAQIPPAAIGRWTNPRHTLAVAMARCADGTLCGAIVWASPQALAQARDAGVTRLIGTPMLQGYRRVGTDRWMGRLYVPDIQRSFSSQIRQTSPATLTISGCLVSGILCRSQVWHRVP